MPEFCSEAISFKTKGGSAGACGMEDCSLDVSYCTLKDESCMQAAAKPSKPAEKDDTAPKDRNGDDNNGPSRGSQAAAPAGGATPGTATASGSAQGNRGGSAGPSNAASLGDRRQSTDRRRSAGKLNVWLNVCYASPKMSWCQVVVVFLSRHEWA